VPGTTNNATAQGVCTPAFTAWRTQLARSLGKAARTEDHQLCWSMHFAHPDGNPYGITSYEYDVVCALVSAQGDWPVLRAAHANARTPAVRNR
jgi:hypothetical protein